MVAGRVSEATVWRYVIGALLVVASLFAGAWKMDEHYVTRVEYNAMLVELHAIHDDVRALRGIPPGGASPEAPGGTVEPGD